MNHQSSIPSISTGSVQQSQGELEWIKSREFERNVLVFSSQNGKYSITLTNGQDSLPWIEAKYLVCEIMNNNPYSAIVYVDFYKKGEDLTEENIVQQGEASDPGISRSSPGFRPRWAYFPSENQNGNTSLVSLDGQEIFMRPISKTA